LPWSEILDNLEFYLEGVLSDFELGKSGNYINDLKEELVTCETPSQVKEVLDEKLPGGDGKRGFEAMRAKIFNAFNNLMKEEILDITNPECHAYLKLKNPEFISNPFSVIMKAGGIPSLITSNLTNKRYKSIYLSHFINQMFTNNLKDFPGEKTFLYFDELRSICEKDDEPASRAIGNVSARGRINNVGLIYATQFYDKIPNCVKGAKLNYAFVFRHNNAKILSEISGDFDLDKKDKEKIKNLKVFECLALTNKKFVCYMDNERYEIEKPIKGQLIYPIANHLKPVSEK
jgi:DNA helicase HerA-like ATPase